MSDDRPDPEALLARIRAEEARQRRGKLKVFFGAAPGVGKTYCMLEAARKQAKDGVDVVVGYVEPHSRPETQALVLGLDLLPKKEVLYRGTRLLEFNLDEALRLRPQLIVVDELAHTNAPGLTHAKRWQDVEQLLTAGIDVYTTLNVQHLESLNDVVAQITGIAVRETVPDAVFEQADEVELVDLPPDDLLERIREGKVYIPQEAQRATEHFFAKGNLIALRELALRKVADRVGAQMDDYRDLQHSVPAGLARERLLVCISPSPFSARVVRAARRMAASLHAPWIVAHVETPRDARLSTVDRQRLAQTFQLAEQLGAETVTLSGAALVDELIHYAHSRNATKIIVGKPKTPRWREWLRGSLVYDLTRRCGDIDVYVISGEPTPQPAVVPAPAITKPARVGYVWAVAVVALCTVVSGLLWLQLQFAPTNLVMVYLLGVVGVALRCGRGPAVLASVLGVAAFDFFFVPPELTFAVQDTQYLFTFAVMLLTAVVIATLTSRVKFQAEAARDRERRTASLYGLSRQLAAAPTRDQIARMAVQLVSEASESPALVLLPGNAERLVPWGTEVGGFVPDARDEAVARWVFEHGQIAGHGTGTLNASAATYLPLHAAHGIVGVLGVQTRPNSRGDNHDFLHLLETFAGLIGLAIERAMLAAEAQRIRLQMETEQLRSSLLSAVSHDLRTPLSVITGAASTLLDGAAEVDHQTRRELLASIVAESETLNRLVANLLDMTRLEAGALEVHKEWQSLEEIVGAALGRLSRQLVGHKVETELPADLPLVPMDGLLVQQVLINLIENATKYSPPESPIDLRAAVVGKWVQVEVNDYGPGLPPGDLVRVFEKFYRVVDPQRRPGAGLGLAIAKGIVELHGGTIEAANRPGGGATLRFTLPLEAAPSALVPAVQLESAVSHE